MTAGEAVVMLFIVPIAAGPILFGVSMIVFRAIVAIFSEVVDEI